MYMVPLLLSMLSLGLSIIADHTCGRANRAEPIVAGVVTIETMIRFQREKP